MLAARALRYRSLLRAAIAATAAESQAPLFCDFDQLRRHTADRAAAPVGELISGVQAAPHWALDPRHGFAKKAKHQKGGRHREEAPKDAHVAYEDFSTSEVEATMQRVIERLKGELANIRPGRASPGMLDHVEVRAYGERMPLKSLAAVSVRDPQLLAATVFDPATADAVAKAIRESPLQLTAQLEEGGSEILVPLPRPTREGLAAMARVAGKEAEAAKVGVRQARKAGMDAAGGLGGEDDVKRAERDVQRLTDRYIGEVERIRQAKEREIMGG
eukprot:evm.model.scf_554.5 EVM.evm.TU.scf_554.5   scf_554:72770-74035(-)